MKRLIVSKVIGLNIALGVAISFVIYTQRHSDGKCK